MVAAFALSLLAQSPNRPTIPKVNDVNPELLNLVIYDQWDRGNDLFGDHRPSPDEKVDVARRDEERRIAVRKLLADGKLQTAKDYRFAALILQHSPDSAGYMQGYMLAHVLASRRSARATTPPNGWRRPPWTVTCSRSTSRRCSARNSTSRTGSGQWTHTIARHSPMPFEPCGA